MLSESKLKILRAVNQGPIRFTDIVDLLERSKKRVAVHINELEEKGLILKNRKTGFYEITDKGRGELMVPGLASPSQIGTEILSEFASTAGRKTSELMKGKVIDERLLILTFMFFLYVSKATSGWKDIDLKQAHTEASEKLEIVRKLLITKIPGWSKGTYARAIEEPISKFPDGPPYSLAIIGICYGFESGLKTIEKDLKLPESEAKRLFEDSRRLVSKAYAKLTGAALKDFLSS